MRAKILRALRLTELIDEMHIVDDDEDGNDGDGNHYGRSTATYRNEEVDDDDEEEDDGDTDPSLLSQYSQSRRAQQPRTHRPRVVSCAPLCVCVCVLCLRCVLCVCACYF
jgi:hypothetical protein